MQINGFRLIRVLVDFIARLAEGLISQEFKNQKTAIDSQKEISSYLSNQLFRNWLDKLKKIIKKILGFKYCLFF